MKSKKLTLTLVMLLLIAAMAFAGGKQEAGTTAAAATVGVTDPLAIYATLSEYEKATGNKIVSFSEAPMLAELVKQGKLPKVSERLPEEPLVISPLEAIGRYGGDLTVASLGPKQGWDAYPARVQGLLKLAPDMQTIVPNIAMAFDMSADKKHLTLQLRKGMKWSDGAPFTADDIMYWYEDMMLNNELTPAKPKSWTAGGEFVKTVKLDDYAVRFEFAAPYPPILLRVGMSDYPFAPRHYLEQYHIRYNSKADDVAKQEGYDSWWQCHAYHFTTWSGNIEARLDDKLPDINSWVVQQISSEGKIFVRNPYFFKIDTAGNQLPYADRQVVRFFESPDVINLKTISGDFSYGTFVLYLDNYPLYKENEQSGDYRVSLWQNPLGSNLGFGFNVTHKDPVLRKIFQDLRFRQAMSLSIDRDEINKVFFYGKGTPRQATATPEGMSYEDWMGEYYAQYDVEKANKLLDEMGLKWDADKEVRMRPDGKPMAIAMEYTPAEAAPEKKILEVVKEYWAAVGIKMSIKEEQRNLYIQRGGANEFDSSSFQFGGNGCEMRLYMLGGILIRPPWGMLRMGMPWLTWYNTDGKSGEEPPEDIRMLFELIDEWQTTLPGSDEYVKLGKEILKRHAEGLYYIGTVGLVPRPVIVKNNVGNMPGDGAVWTVTYNFFSPHMAEQWYLKQ